MIENKTIGFEERGILDDKDMMEQIRASERNIKKGKIKELKY